MKRKLRRVTAVVIIAAGTAAVTLMVGLVTNVASEQQQWPGVLVHVQRFPWQSLAVLAIVAVGLASVFAALSTPTIDSSAAAERSADEKPPLSLLAPALRTLPRDLAQFANRREEIEWLREQIDHASAGGGTLPIHTIDGMPGVGKTAFAVHIGHVLSRRFPDGQLFLDLNGFTPGRSPVPPSEALASLLLADGVPPQMIPGGDDPWLANEARAALWRSRIANRRMLVILDNAASFQQVEHLLPSAGESLVLVTSRRRLVAPEAVNLLMDKLAPDAAIDLFIGLSGRSELDAEEVGELVDSCGYLPLAISLLAARLRHHPSWSADDLKRRIVSARDRMSEMRAGDRAVAAAFDLSYQDLAHDAQRFFLRVSMCPGQDFDEYAAAALGDATCEEARGHLEALYEDHLLDEADQGRYRLHDLVRDYARSVRQAELPDDRAVERLAAYYLHALESVNSFIGRETPRTADAPASPAVRLPAGFDSSPSALAWMDTEHANVLACLSECHARGDHMLVVRLADAMFPYLRHAGPWDRALNVHQTAVTSAKRVMDRAAEADALGQVGTIYRLMANYPAAIDMLSGALETYRELEDQAGQGRILNQLGIVRYLTADYPRAEAAQRQALDLCRECGDVLGQANALADLGMVLRVIGTLAASAEAQSEALSLYRRIGDRFGEANALRALGVVSCLRGDYGDAVRQSTAALEIYQQIDDSAHQAYALNELGAAQQRSGDTASAVQSHENALRRFRDLGDRFGEAEAMRSLGAIRRRQGDLDDAERTQQQVLEIYIDLDSRGGQAATTCELGIVSRMRRNVQASEEALSRALTIYRDVGDRCGQAATLNQLGLLSLTVGDPSGAAEQLSLALKLAQDAGLRLEEADALYGLAQADESLGSHAAAEANRRAALAIYEASDLEPPGPLSTRA